MKTDSVIESGKQYDKIFYDKLSLYYVLNKYREYLPKYYGIIVLRDGKRKYIQLPSSENISLKELLNKKEQLLTINSKTNKIDKLELNKSRYYFNEKEVLFENIIDCLEIDSIISEDFILNKKIINLCTIKDDALISKFIKYYDVNEKIKNKILEIANDFPEVKYMNFYIVANENSFYIYQINTIKELIGLENIDENLKEFIENKFSGKKNKSIKDNIKDIMDRVLVKRGWQGYMYRNYLHGLVDDFKHKKVSILKKVWANYNGFFSYRIEQYGLTKTNYKNFLSDKDYKWLRNINNYYRKWFRDKIQFYYVLKEHDRYLPTYYFHIINKNCKLEIISYCDTKKTKNINDIILKLKEVGIFAMKPAVSSHGKGFYKLEYKDNKFYINNVLNDENKLYSFFQELKGDYLISEYVIPHEQIKKIYDKSVSTIRMMVINTNGDNPAIMSAYMRIGNDSSGEVDNIANGGFSVMLDYKTGKIIKAEKIIDHVYYPIDNHPDTKEEIKGFIPYWDTICNSIKDICRYISVIEYMGFDIVVTQDSFKILEINMHQELHKYPEYSDDVKKYLNDKLKLKKYGTRLC